MACAERGITHMECLANLDKLVGPRRFRSTYWPLLIVMPTKVGIHDLSCRCQQSRGWRAFAQALKWRG